MKINVARHIFELLSERESAYVPELGSFVLERLPSSFGEGRKSLLPPSANIKFVESKSDDSKLIGKIAKQENISKDKASAYVAKFSALILDALIDKGKAEVGNLGVFQKEGDSIAFIPNQNTLNNFYRGLPEIQIPHPKVVAKGQITETKTASSTSQIKSVPITGQTHATASVASTSTFEPIAVPKEPSGGLSSCLWPILGLLLVLGACYLLFKSCNNSGEVKPIINTENPDPIIDSIQNLNDTVVDTLDFAETTVGSTDETVNEQSDVEIAKLKEEGEQFKGEQCIIILGAYSNVNNASSLMESIKASNLDLYNETYGPYHRVGFSFDCSQEEDLKAYLRNVRKQFARNAWYLVPELHVQ